MVGLNVINIDPEQIKMSLYYIYRERSSLISTINKIAGDQSLSVEERERRLQSFRQKLSNYDLQEEQLTQAGRISSSVISRLKREALLSR